MRVVCIIQARTGSARLPKKVLMQIEGKTVLEHVLARVSCSKLIDKIVVATTDKKQDDCIVDLLKSNKQIKTFRGSENDVLDRYYKAALQEKADVIVRITSDCPLIDHEIVDDVIKKFLSKKTDYTSNFFGGRTFARGLDTEVFSFEALQKAWREAKENHEREHVTPYIWGHPEIFSCASLKSQHDFSKYRWTLDEKTDFKLIKRIYKKLYKSHPDFLTKAILTILKNEPQLSAINAHIDQKPMRIVIATIKSWHIKAAERFKNKNKQYGVTIITDPKDLTSKKIKEINPDFIFFPHWSWLIPEEIYAHYKCVVFHMTDLPFGRGGSPLQNLIIRKIYKTKISAIEVDGGVDTGKIFLKEPFDISKGSAKEIFERMSKIIFGKMIKKILKNKIIPRKQVGKVVKFKRRKPEESDINKARIETPKDFYDFVRMLDAEGYEKAFIRIGKLKIEFSKIKGLNGKFEIKKR